MSTLHVQLLGEWSLVYGDEGITTVSRPRLQSLLAYLVLHRDRPHSRRHLAYLYYPESSESQARTNLRKLLHDLRGALPDAELFLETDGTAVQWRPDAPFTLDVNEFESALSGANSSSTLRNAISLYGGELLPDCYDDWVLAERERLRARFAEALENLIARLESVRDFRAAIPYAQRLVEQDSLREEPYRDLMRLYALSGNRAGALRTYHALTATLQRELQIAPSPATLELYQRLLKTDPLPLPMSSPHL